MMGRVRIIDRARPHGASPATILCKIILFAAAMVLPAIVENAEKRIAYSAGAR
ncbi:hypothetical protein [Paracoccus shandongensis]|uniref:hypothetical protein n=1 Tax=Paracoccus shandongensis TaxID=2816048 RepID=UPI001A8F085F|nr:hypothetical protein [Paracoccus shandongensis]